MIRYRAFVLSILLLPALLSAQTTRVLFIGNSYTYSNDLPGMFTQLAASMGETVQTQMVAPGGYTFEGHTSYAQTQAALAQGNWDFVVLQEQSQRPAFPPEQVAQEVLPYAAQLAQQARAASPCAEVVYLMTWGRENGDAANCAFYPPVCTYEGMQQRLYESYVEMAAANDGWCAPAGEVWRTHRAAFPGTGLYTDGSHPNVLGSYIAASTLASTLFRRSCATATYIPAGITTEQAQSVRTMASDVVASPDAPWNIGVNDPVAAADLNYLDGYTVLFADNTTGAASWSWDFGDGSGSTDADPLHTYAGPGEYAVWLVVQDACERTDSLQLTVTLVNTGIGENGRSTTSTVRMVDGQLQVTSGVGGMLQLFDPAGKSLLSTTVTGGPRSITLPSDYQGVLVWQLSTLDGLSSTGRLHVP
jgi:hypothetical protein